MTTALHQLLTQFNGAIWDRILIYLLMGVGIVFTIRTGFVQIRGSYAALHLAFRPDREKSHAGAISRHQAFAIGLASRVGTGNIVGVAVALTLGGPGAIFWMWVVAILGMSSGFAEATLAQIFKIRTGNRAFRGGPSYYIQFGLGSRRIGVLFAIALIIAFGFVFNAVQAKSMAETLHMAFDIPPLLIGIFLAGAVALVIFGGVGRVAWLAARLVPLNALLYLGLAAYVIITHAAELPAMLKMIVENAFGFDQAAGGVAGVAVQAALLTGIKRGLFSNEAGMGSAPNAAATASAKHPAEQGLLQMLGVVFDTMIVCTATAAIILLSGLYDPQAGIQGAALVLAAIQIHVGHWGGVLFALTVTLFAFSAIIGNYAYAESNVQFICNHPAVLHSFRLGLLAMLIFGTLASLPVIWDLADSSAGLMALINLLAILLLSPHVCAAWRDYLAQRRQGIAEPLFDRFTLPALTTRLPKDVW